MPCAQYARRHALADADTLGAFQTNAFSHISMLCLPAPSMLLCHVMLLPFCAMMIITASEGTQKHLEDLSTGTASLRGPKRSQPRPQTVAPFSSALQGWSDHVRWLLHVSAAPGRWADVHEKQVGDTSNWQALQLCPVACTPREFWQALYRKLRLTVTVTLNRQLNALNPRARHQQAGWRLCGCTAATKTTHRSKVPTFLSWAHHVVWHGRPPVVPARQCEVGNVPGEAPVASRDNGPGQVAGAEGTPQLPRHEDHLCK